MRFALVDQIIEFEPGKSIIAVKSPSLAEEYLQDHFPLFPVMPGVLMLESMYQTAAWLLRITDDFSHSLVLLKEARNVKYSGFVRPGQTLRVTATVQSREDAESKFKVEGRVDGELAVSARLILNQSNLADDDPSQEMVDKHICRCLRHELRQLSAAFATGGESLI